MGDQNRSEQYVQSGSYRRFSPATLPPAIRFDKEMSLGLSSGIAPLRDRTGLR